MALQITVNGETEEVEGETIVVVRQGQVNKDDVKRMLRQAQCPWRESEDTEGDGRTQLRTTPAADDAVVYSFAQLNTLSILQVGG